MLNQRNYRNVKVNPLLIVAGFLVLIAIFRTGTNNAVTTTSITTNWNLQDLDITKNGNLLRALLFLETSKTATPTSPSPSAVFNKPSDFYGQYLQFSGTIKSARSYSPRNNLENIIAGNLSEMILIASDGTTIVDCYLIDNNSSLTAGSSVSVYGYSPGIRYYQDSQGRISSQLILVGHLRTDATSTPDVSPTTTFPVSPSWISPVSPTPS